MVAAGKLGCELDVYAVAEDVDAYTVKFPESEYSNPVVYLKEANDGPLVTLFRTGSYHITGGKNVEEVRSAKNWMVSQLSELGIHIGEVSFSVKNTVLVGDLERELDLSQIAVWLGLDQTEYEPEQFPGLVYRPVDGSCVFLLFASGRVVVTGAPDFEVGVNEFEELMDRLESL